MHPFKIAHLDHVAINVKDMNVSIAWYKKVLGLKEYKVEKWGEYPVFMLKEKFGIAIFPADLNDPSCNPKSNNVKIDHFAFNLSNEDFEKAIAHYSSINLNFRIKDHHYFKSIYTKDPDGHTVELTTLVVDEKEFY
ncbi:MAG: VOC family protein [Bacteroidia bacterium]|nr:VOC family protein [Bacteroidia bacterium]